MIVRARRVVLPGGERAAAVHVADGRVTAVTGFDDVTGPVHTLADDEVLLPGLVDSHVHVNEPGRTEWEGFVSATRAAAAGGVTTIVDMPLNSIPPTTSVAALREKQAAARGRVAVDVAFWGGAVPGNVDQLRPLHEAGVVGFKCFLLDSGVPEFPPLDDPGLRAALGELAGFDGLLIAHAEDPDVIAAAPEPVGGSYASFLASRPGAAEETAIGGLVAAARDTGARVHVVHLADADALPLLRAARAEGVRVTVETCPHYLTFDAAEVPDGDTAFKCCPPIREASHREALWAALAAGDVDLVVSDHSPCTPDLKRLDVGDFGLAWGGIASLQVSLPAVWSGARARGLGLAQVVDWMSAAPARLAGLPGKGAIAVGRDADLVAFAPEETWTVGELHHRNPVTPYAGRRLTGVVRRTWLAGREIGDVPLGRLLGRGSV
ncbi:allantoinase AllB [Modestobacter sp. I12A-02628]|uniref:allantoinase n=1 Tax=Goekera deserti TaxID=2497753 RepID=A0A7K3WKC4_9ACTN|nr:allantoinase AllB [Goekera deserti]MPQ97737.1 allantoinase AllB [Goekera deserti]NDI48382.1 allantoinase AllB [Goekera deserti]NEL55983.1 allantoinase AllB [Goekera deserti]